MIVSTKEMLEKAFQSHSAIVQFNINNLEWTKFILEKCNEMQKPVILGVSESAIHYMGGYHVVVNMIKGLIFDLRIVIPVAIHLDHGSSIESCQKAIEAGFTSVMIDASKYDIETNIKITKKVVEIAHPNKVTVEAEIGRVGGMEDKIASDIYYANVEESYRLVKETNIDSLAPSVGNVHGLYKGDPKLNFELIQQISQKVKIPLVLHGGTGIDEEKIKKAISCGIAKLNINTELQVAWSNAIRKYLDENKDIYDPRKIIQSGENAIKQVIENKLHLLEQQ